MHNLIDFCFVFVVSNSRVPDRVHWWKYEQSSWRDFSW